MKNLITVISFTVLTGCASLIDVAKDSCDAYGYTPETQEYRKCVYQKSTQYESIVTTLAIAEIEASARANAAQMQIIQDAHMHGQLMHVLHMNQLY